MTASGSLTDWQVAALPGGIVEVPVVNRGMELGRLLLRSRSSAPVSVEKARGIRTVIVPIDGSGGAVRALPYAQLLARSLDAEIELLAVADTPARRRRLQSPLERARRPACRRA